MGNVFPSGQKFAAGSKERANVATEAEGGVRFPRYIYKQITVHRLLQSDSTSQI